DVDAAGRADDGAGRVRRAAAFADDGGTGRGGGCGAFDIRETHREFQLVFTDLRDVAIVQFLLADLVSVDEHAVSALRVDELPARRAEGDALELRVQAGNRSAVEGNVASLRVG